jgi:2-hydroxychromene-2-carboxylate isomerase
MALQTVRFYFSFRSPYAWFAAERWHLEVGDVSPSVERIPFFPTRETFPNDPALVPAKLRYVVQDMKRLARAYGLALRGPSSLDTDWARPHAAYLGVERQQPERAEAFLLETFRARFSRGEDVALDEVLRAASSPELQGEVAGSFARGQRDDGIFGAPSFVYDGQLFWGHDRMPHLRAAILEARERRVAVTAAACSG